MAATLEAGAADDESGGAEAAVATAVEEESVEAVAAGVADDATVDGVAEASVAVPVEVDATGVALATEGFVGRRETHTAPASASTIPASTHGRTPPVPRSAWKTKSSGSESLSEERGGCESSSREAVADPFAFAARAPSSEERRVPLVSNDRASESGAVSYTHLTLPTKA